MGGCCGAQGTANGAGPNPGAPPARDKAKTTLIPADAKEPARTPAKTPAKEPTPAPAKAAETKPPIEAETSKPAAPAAPQPSEEKKPAEKLAETKDEKPAAAPPSEPLKAATPPTPAAAATETPAATPKASAPPASASVSPAGPPAAQASPRPSTPPAVPLAAHEEVKEHHESLPLLKAEEASKAHAGNPPTKETNASPPPPNEPEAEAPVADVNVLPSPAAQTPSPTNVTPERAPAPPTQHRDEDGVRGPSTAQVEEVPPTPAEESDVATGKALPADDARVLQRVPPPPPPPPSSFTPEASKKNADDDDGDGNAAKAAAEANPLADILRRQQEEKQRYPTALTTDAADDAPLEISMEEDRNDTAGKAAATGAAKYAATETEGAMDGAAPMNDAAPTQGVVFKILGTSEWAKLRESGQSHGNSADRANGYITFGTAEQATQHAEKLQQKGTSPYVLVCCTMAALAKPAEKGADAPLRWETVAHTGQRAPRLYRALHRATDVLWYRECASGSEVVLQLRKEMASADGSSSEAAEDDAPEKLAYVHNDNDDDKNNNVGNKPISFTDTSEIEREQAAGGKTPQDKDDTTPRMSPPANEEEEADSFNIPDKSDEAEEGDGEKVEEEEEEYQEEEEEEDKPQVVVRDVLPDITLAAAAGVPREPRPPTQHVVSAMQAPEAVPVSPQEQAPAAAPRRVPPPLPSPPAEVDDGVEDGATPPPSRSAPQTILSPPPA